MNHLAILELALEIGAVHVELQPRPLRDATVSAEELEGVIGRARGILGYCQQYWGGYYPLFLIRMADGTTPVIKKDLVDKLEAIFSCCLHTSLPENFTKKEEAGLMDSLFRLYLHMFKLRCADGSGPHEKLGVKTTSWRCPGQCGLSVQPVTFHLVSLCISLE